MPQNRHRQLASRVFECRTQPRELFGIDPPDDTGIDGEEGEAIARTSKNGAR
jgi:hypothetical protein